MIWHHFGMESSAAITVVVLGVVIGPGLTDSRTVVSVDMKFYHTDSDSVVRSAVECRIT